MKARKKKTPLKKSLSGLEIELFLIDDKGRPSSTVDKIIKKVKKKHPDIEAKKECNKQMLEITSLPNVKVYNTAQHLTDSIQKTIEICNKDDISVFPFATYPGKFSVDMRKDAWYRQKEIVLGKERFQYAGMCAGVHYHYTLPRGVFDFKKNWLKPLVNSKIKQSMIDSYNMCIALDPVLIGLTQCSPFVQGNHYGKDSRVIVYRGGKKLRFMNGTYAKFQMVGALPPYKQTLSDLLFSLKRRQLSWKQRMIKQKLNTEDTIKENNILEFTWNPVKINRLGTMEQRSIDTNYLSHIIAISSFLKFVHRRIQQDFLRVMPSDIGTDEPFKIERNIVYIPPHTLVRNKLQRMAAYEGLANDEVYAYCQRFIRLGKNSILKGYRHAVRPLCDMIEERKTVSDKIIVWFKKKGYSTNSELPADICREFALKHAEHMKKDLERTEKTVSRLEGL